MGAGASEAGMGADHSQMPGPHAGPGQGELEGSLCRGAGLCGPQSSALLGRLADLGLLPKLRQGNFHLSVFMKVWFQVDGSGRKQTQHGGCCFSLESFSNSAPPGLFCQCGSQQLLNVQSKQQFDLTRISRMRL